MPMGNLMGWLYKMCDWVTSLVYVNLLWIGFSLLGLLLFGIGPATSAMFTVIRKWLMGEEDVKVFLTFWQTYKKDFLKTNFLILILLAVGGLLYLDFLFIGNFEGMLVSILSGLLILLTILYFLTLVFVFPVFVQFELKPLQYIKYAVHLGIYSPLSILIILASILFMYYLTLFIPAIFPFFSGSIISLIIMYQAEQSIEKIKNKYIISA
ncbi:YesL family protein [Aquibacillus albus]|uniref:Membrane protein YesL n=1 Tax=Aquibacillus albus TaxID=1168171 RepID=A0ABS2N496_9BACI|nr:DUF624 domain-containing protein [Aquibacillus albus]MBM7572964.1 putative membrane protein YesL [Aquibacillus albus]